MVDNVDDLWSSLHDAAFGDLSHADLCGRSCSWQDAVTKLFLLSVLGIRYVTIPDAALSEISSRWKRLTAGKAMQSIHWRLGQLTCHDPSWRRLPRPCCSLALLHSWCHWSAPWMLLHIFANAYVTFCSLWSKLPRMYPCFCQRASHLRYRCKLPSTWNAACFGGMDAACPGGMKAQTQRWRAGQQKTERWCWWCWWW